MSGAGPCGRCAACEERRFREWAARIRAGLGADDHEDAPRTRLLVEMLTDLGRRYPWGIAEDLIHVLDQVGSSRRDRDPADGDGIAAAHLDDLADMEAASLRLNPSGPGQDCGWRS